MLVHRYDVFEDGEVLYYSTTVYYGYLAQVGYCTVPTEVRMPGTPYGLL